MALPQYSDHLLPRNSTALERVLSAAGARMTGLPVQIDLLKRPFDCPTQFLPHLGFELSVDVWENSWTEMRKRTAISRAIPLQQKKGTGYTLREYVRYADAEVIKIERPPQGVFAGKSLTKEEREAWLETLPQIRLWSIRDTVNAPSRKMFINSNNSRRMHSARFCLSWGCLVPSSALVRHGRRARWVVGGVETDTRVSNDGSIEQLHIPSVAGLSAFCGRPMLGRYLTVSTSSRRLVTIQPAQSLPWRSAVTPSMQAITAEPERVKVGGTRGLQLFCGMPMRGFLVKTTAPMRIYDRYAVYDGSVPAHRAATMFMNHGRFGWPAHYARVYLSVPSQRSGFAFGLGINMPKKFLVPHNPEPLAKAMRAIRASKRLSDRIDLVIGPIHKFVAGKTFIAGVDSYIAP